MKFLAPFFILSFLLYSCSTTVKNAPKFQEGDILFQDLDCGGPCNAIEAVTEGVNGWDFSHCGIVVEKEGQLQVIEAYGAVQAVPIDSFLQRYVDSAGKPKVVIGRPKDQTIATKSAQLAFTYLGKDYDRVFQLNDDKYYCSELVYECFKAANDNEPFFPLNVMTFKAPNTDSIMNEWMEYYEPLNTTIPEGEMGINPGAISRSNKLEIIYLH
ncbi:MAG: YiiX/YebB-like N1pC/P60 family cysteine hydrolase [Flavipsychrobacter sp.]